MSAIATVTARQVLDSRGNPTVEAEVTTTHGAWGRAIVPSGASTGTLEAVELRDGGGAWGGKGVSTAIANVNGEIAAALRGEQVDDQAAVDDILRQLDGTPNKARLGANAVLAASMACAHAAAGEHGEPLWRYLAGSAAGLLPVPLMNVLNGGVHADNRLDVQEFLIVPAGAPDFATALRIGSEVFHALGRELAERRLARGVGDEGGFAPDLESNEDALSLMVHAVELAGYTPGEDVYLALDPAASEFHRGGRYELSECREALDQAELVEYWTHLALEYPLISLEDGMAEDDRDGWRRLTEALGDRLQLIGDDNFVTNPELLERGIDDGIANAILIKLNQIGTVTETLETMALARDAGYASVVSHRSGETEDVTIAHLAVATGCGQIKTGAPSRSERVAKYNELLRIEESLGAEARYAGIDAFARGASPARGTKQ